MIFFHKFGKPNKCLDIDTDFSRFARQYAVDYVTEFYGAKAVCGIMTKGTMKARKALTYAPKLLAKKHGYDVKAFNEKGAKLRKLLGKEINIELSEIEEDVQKEFKDDKIALEIFDIAKKIEGKITSYGQHAAGIISIMDGDVQDYIPCMMAQDADKKDKMVVQADMVVCEAQLGFIKFDFLGLKNLNSITFCQQMITKTTGDVIDPYNLPLDDEKVFSDIFASGNTDFVFQFESDGMKGMLREFKPTKFEDLILAVSVYRPGPMDFIPDIIKCKNKGVPSPIVERIPILKETLAETYGFPVYQEQVMRIMTLCAGFTMGHADNVRRFMSKKKEDKLAAEKPAFVEGCVKTNGIKAEDAEWLFDQLMPFAKYGFNKSHAAAYSLVSYITAWLKCHYTKQYLCAAMSEQGEKTLQFQSECKKYKIEVYPVSINKSDVNYSIDGEGVRIGLSAIKGLKADANEFVAARGDGYSSITDIIKKAKVKSDSLKSTILSGACDEFIRNRETAIKYVEEFKDLYDKKLVALEKIETYSNNGDEKKTAEWNEKLKLIESDIKKLNPHQTFDLSDEKKRNYELEFLGMYLSGSPLDDYDTENPKYNTAFRAFAEDEKFFSIGVVINYSEFKTSKGQRMAKCQILDKDSNTTDMVIFPRQFEKLDFELTDGTVIEIKGTVEENSNGDDSNESDDSEEGTLKNIQLQIIADEIKSMKNSHKNLFVEAEGLKELSEILNILKVYSTSKGLNVKIAVLNSYREVSYQVSEEAYKALKEKNFHSLIA